MASQKKIIEIIMCIKNTYAQYTKEINVEALVKTWVMLLKDYPDEAVEFAFYKCLQTCEKPPLPAHIIKELNNLLETTETTDEELWSIYTKALDKVLPEVSENGYIKCPLFGQTSADAHRRIESVWNGLPERLQQYIGSKGELMRMARDFTDNDLKFEKQRFLKTMPSIKKRVEYSQTAALIGGEQPKQIEG